MGTQIGVVGSGECGEEVRRLALAVGEAIGRSGAVLVCGGLGGVMEAAARGAQAAGGLTVGILPGLSRHDANSHIIVPIVTGLSHARNVIVARSSDVLIAVAGGYGTLSEIAIALKLGKPVIGLRTWAVSDEVIQVDDPAEAVEIAMKRAAEMSG